MALFRSRSWFYLVTHSYSRQVVRTLWPALFCTFLYAAGVCFLVLDVMQVRDEDFHSTTAMHSLLGIVLGLFLVFRTNTAYDRWWEGRKLWGSLVNNTRNLAIKLQTFLPPAGQPDRQWFAAMISNFAAAVRDHLRDHASVERLQPAGNGWPPGMAHAAHLPNAVALALYQRINALYQQQVFSGYQLLLVDRELKEFSDICGACERIKNTPIPNSYSMYIKKFIFIYLLTLPFGFVTEMRYWTIPIVLLIGFVLLSVALIAEEIEDPFGGDANDLPTHQLTKNISADVHEILLGRQAAATP